jgi:hypothetical protein
MDEGTSSKRARLEGPREGGLVMMLTHVEELCGSFQLWGVTAEHGTVLLRCDDFRPYFFLPAPCHSSGASRVDQQQQDLQLQHLINARWGRTGAVCLPCPASTAPLVQSTAPPLPEHSTPSSRAHHPLFHLPRPRRLKDSDCKAVAIQPVLAQPIMYYRADDPRPGPCLQVLLCPGGNAKKAAAVVEGLARQDGLRSHGSYLEGAGQAGVRG